MLLLFVFLWLQQPSFGAADGSQKADSLLRLPDVNVTAEAPAAQTGAHPLLYSVTRQDFQHLQVESVNDLLACLPGIDLRARGVNGVQADAGLNGGTIDQVKVYINGVNFTDPQTGHYTLNLPLPMEMVSRIEVRQGAIHILTRPTSDTDTMDTYQARLTGGRFGLWNTCLTGQWHRTGHAHAAGVEYNQSGGYIDNTDYRIANLYYAGSLYGVELQAGAQYKDAGANSFYSLASQDQFDATRTAFLSARYANRWGRWGMEALAAYRANHDRYEWHRGSPVGGNRHLSQTVTALLKGTYSTALSRTEWGMELRNENIVSTNLGDSLAPSSQPLYPLGKNRLHLHYFARQSVTYSLFSASVGAKGEWNSLNGNQWSGDLSLACRYAQTGKVTFDAVRSLRQPTFTDLYYHAGIQRGNINLNPERAWTFSLGTVYTWRPLTVRANAFYRLGRDIIDWQKQPDNLYYATNISALDAAGGQTALVWRSGGRQSMSDFGYWITRAEVSYSYTHLFLNNVDISRSMYLDYLSHKLLLRLDHRIYGNLGASWELSWQNREGSYQTADGTMTPYGAVWLLDGSIFYRIDGRQRYYIALSCANLTNTRYYCYGGILQPGITPKATIRIEL